MQSRDWTGICGCFSYSAGQVAGVSLNRTEQRLFDYVERHPEERHFWFGKVQRIAGELPDPHAAATRLEVELWNYYRERAGVAAELREAAQREGLARTSMKNLAEYLMRLWVAPKLKKKNP